MKEIEYEIKLLKQKRSRLDNKIEEKQKELFIEKQKHLIRTQKYNEILIKKIYSVVCDYFNVSVENITDIKAKKYLCYFLYHKAFMKQKDIKILLGYKTCGNVSTHIKRLREYMSIYSEYKKAYDDINSEL